MFLKTKTYEGKWLLYITMRCQWKPGALEDIGAYSENYWWPGITKFVKVTSPGAITANATRISTTTRWFLEPSTNPQSSWEEISVDMITDLPLSKGYDSILVVVDSF